LHLINIREKSEVNEMPIFGKRFGKKKGEAQKVEPKRVASSVPKCAICGKIITRQADSIADNILLSGGVVGGGSSLNSSMYNGTICPACGSAFCLSCQRPSPDICPKCGQAKLRPAFADLMQKYYRA
jgi:hypothetical protein